jgi:hypothetical protein
MALRRSTLLLSLSLLAAACALATLSLIHI